MPANHVWGIEWLNANSMRSYPLSDSASKTNGSFRIPDGLILALYFPVNASVNVEPENFFISSLTVFGTGLSLTLSYYDGTNSISAATAVMSFDGHTEYKSYALAGSGDFVDSVGKVVFGKLEYIEKLDAGQHLFTYNQAKLDTDVVRPIIRGVSSVVLVNGSDKSERLNGVLELVAGNNMRLSVVSSSSASNDVTQIRFDAISGAGLSNSCVCTTDDDTSPCISTINGISPTLGGDFSFLTDECLELTAQTNGLKIEDVCSKPCCGCAELEAVTNDLTRFGDAALTLQNYLNRLEGSVNRMNITILGSRLGDAGCVNC